MSSRKRRTSQMPEVNLVPMMDVLMTVLTFFIIISMTLQGQQILNINLPGIEGDEEAKEQVDSNLPALIVGLNADGEIVLESQIITLEELTEAMQEHLTEHEDGIVLLKADRELSYSDVSAMLKAMRDIGGDRVSLAIGNAGAQ